MDRRPEIRGDYGVTGNQDFGNYLSLSTMNSFGSYYYNGQYFTVWGAGKNPNPGLKWEKVKLEHRRGLQHV